jgi:MYXO-CTERM domain-containing protein
MLGAEGSFVYKNYVHDLIMGIDADPGVDPNLVGGAVTEPVATAASPTDSPPEQTSACACRAAAGPNPERAPLAGLVGLLAGLVLRRRRRD